MLVWLLRFTDEPSRSNIGLVIVSGRTVLTRPVTLKKIENIYAKYGKWKNKVWWVEHWLPWGTARQMLDEAGVTV
jgi:hypothetical protein